MDNLSHNTRSTSVVIGDKMHVWQCKLAQELYLLLTLAKEPETGQELRVMTSLQLPENHPMQQYQPLTATYFDNYSCPPLPPAFSLSKFLTLKFKQTTQTKFPTLSTIYR